MPDPVTIEAVRSILDIAIVGPICVILAAVLVWRERMWRADIKLERDAHQVTRDRYLADVKTFATIGESVRDQMKAQVAMFNTMIDLIKDRDR